ncbi:HAD family hydrolase [Paenibacillus sp. KQZ6P-2]|uniref:HAD family hydrolase n=1 Tax=Paenibacillus mangrovi TaxID=2931978 RepID=A0A9X1WPE0_9BACL|nr:HAD family hydrolase [Paenibacillus mangrovi]MCJ8012623.1 HAD family hydrolase [Paenibacillus mangrovi]
MQQIKGILFDKDGTLMDFYSGWVPVGTGIADLLVEDVGLKDDPSAKASLLESIGLHGDTIDPAGILAGGTTQEMAEAFVRVLRDKQVNPDKLEHLEDWLTRELHQLTLSNRHNLRPTADLHLLLGNLRRYGLKLGIATADDLESTKFFLELAGVTDYFDFIGTSDYYEKKPNPCMLRAFCEVGNMSAEEVAVVGDTVTDMRFARNSAAGVAIGVLSGVSGIPQLQDADLVIPSVADIVQADGRLIWQHD